ncbi:unnamed protein product [Linum trigynum]
MFFSQPAIHVHRSSSSPRLLVVFPRPFVFAVVVAVFIPDSTEVIDKQPPYILCQRPSALQSLATPSPNQVCSFYPLRVSSVNMPLTGTSLVPSPAITRLSFLPFNFDIHFAFAGFSID